MLETSALPAPLRKMVNVKEALTRFFLKLLYRADVFFLEIVKLFHSPVPSAQSANNPVLNFNLSPTQTRVTSVLYSGA